MVLEQSVLDTATTSCLSADMCDDLLSYLVLAYCIRYL